MQRLQMLCGDCQFMWICRNGQLRDDLDALTTHLIRHHQFAELVVVDPATSVCVDVGNHVVDVGFC